MARTHRPIRRLLFAGAATACTLIAALAVVGVANAGSGGDLPDSFRLAERHAGDMGQWHSVSTAMHSMTGSAHACTGINCGSSGGGSQTETEDNFAWNESFEWLPEQAWRDGDGAWHAVHGYMTVDHENGMTMSVNGKETHIPQWDVSWLEASTGQYVGTTRLGGGGVSASSGSSGTEESISVRTVTTWEVSQACGLGDKLRAGIEDLEEPIVASGCTMDDEPVAFHAVGVENLNGLEAVRFDATTEDETISYWFNPSLPEPVQVHREIASDFPSETTRRLTGFTSGDQPWNAGTALPTDSPIPQAELAKREGWGPQDSGIEHPFPLSLAWQKAASDPTYPGFKEFLDANPDASVSHARYGETRDGSTTHRTWDVLVCGQNEDYDWFKSTQTAQYAGGAVTDLLGQPPVGPPVVTYSTDGSSSPFVTSSVSGCLDPSTLVDEMLTVTSAQAAWQAFTGIEQPINSWEVMEGMDGLQLTVGREPFEHVDNGNETAQFLVFAQDGTLLSHIQEDTQFTRTASGLLQGGAGGSVSASSGVIGIPRMAPQTMGLYALPIQGTTGASFLALLSGLLVWFWPAIKGTPVIGLFSRLKEDKLLGHPVRAEIVQRIESQPGIHYQELLRGMGGGKGGLEHHLRKLEDARLVRAVRGPYYTCYFPWAATQLQRDAAPALKSEGARRVLAAVQAQPGISGQELSSRTGLSASSVSEHVKHLSAAGLLHASRQGRIVRVEPTTMTRQASGAAA